MAECVREAAHKLLSREREQTAALAVAIISPTESDLAVLQFQQPVIGDGDAMGVTPEIVEHLPWSTEGRLAYTTHSLRSQTMNEMLEGDRVIELC